MATKTVFRPALGEVLALYGPGLEWVLGQTLTLAAVPGDSRIGLGRLGMFFWISASRSGTARIGPTLAAQGSSPGHQDGHGLCPLLLGFLLSLWSVVGSGAAGGGDGLFSIVPRERGLMCSRKQV